MSERSPVTNVEVARSPQGSNPWVLAVLIAGSALCAFPLLQKSTDVVVDDPAAPALEFETVRCAQTEDTALRHADDLMRRARLRWERVLFEPESAVAALHDVEHAAACFDVAQKQTAEQEARVLAGEYRKQIEREYRRLRLKLRIALQRDDVPTARASIASLRALINNDEEPYSRWLLSLEHRLVLEGDTP